jgi:hypothetical protein
MSGIDVHDPQVAAALLDEITRWRRCNDRCGDQPDQPDPIAAALARRLLRRLEALGRAAT